MAYISSEKIKVFPSIGRNTDIDADAELMNEGNISSIIRSLCRERKSYVLSKTFSASDENPFEFVIYGFYFKVTDISSLSDRPLYAHITLKENTGNYQLLTISNSTVSNNSLQILDQNVSQSSQFQGVWFDSKSTGGTYDLQLLDDNGHIPATSLLHVKTNEILDGESSNYINNSFTTTSLTTSSLNATNATTETLTVTGSSNLKGAVTVSSTLTVSGATSLADTTVSTLTVKGSVNAADQTITASTFIGNLIGNADTASTFSSNRTITLTGPITGSSTSSDGVHSISTTITTSAVTTEKIADKAVTTEKLGFGVTMTLTVNDKTLVLSVPKLENN